MIEFVESCYDTCVSERQQRVCMDKLKERMDAGETPDKILGIPLTHSYYIDKIVRGQVRITQRLRFRILGLPPLKNPDVRSIVEDD